MRNHFFEQNKPEGGKSLQGTCPIFLSAKGKEPRETSNFKLVILNKAVFGKKAKTKSPRNSCASGTRHTLTITQMLKFLK